jgi:modulator of FtsH protease
MRDWASFFQAEVGAAAALTGLLFVAMAENREKILQLGRMADRGLEALLMLFLSMIAASFPLMPNQSMLLLGSEVGAAGVIVLILAYYLQRTYLRDLNPVYVRRSRWMVRMNRLAVLLIATGGISIASLSADIGLRVLAFGILLTFWTAAMSSWVLLVEINR